MIFKFGILETNRKTEVKILEVDEEGYFKVCSSTTVCMYCQTEMDYVDGLLKKREGGLIKYFYECVQLHIEDKRGCGAKFEIIRETDELCEFGERLFIGNEIGYAEAGGVYSCSSVIFPEYNSWRNQ